ncbi:hypothetical protein HERIO_93 [Hepatospora eriocheir]|uniref:Uncharacterized protein n=1 Tax=Hepatospora eriocheir TaxID=1081669 RepID=A0A1X0QE59_9MICR|nr:hypothetical protein HERIO_93 [Hepatospora eriocheir]
MEPFLKERDTAIRSLTREQKVYLFKKVIKAFPKFQSLLPYRTYEDVDLFEKIIKAFPKYPSLLATYIHEDIEYYDMSFINMLKVTLLENFEAKVELEVFENPYIENTKLERIICLDDNKGHLDKINYREGVEKCDLFNFFGEEEVVDLSYFNLIYDLYLELGIGIILE